MSEQLKKSIGARVKAARQQKGLTQPQLAEAINKAFETISNIERGKTAPNFITLADIATVVEVPMRDFFDADDQSWSDTRKQLMPQLSMLALQLDDEQLALFLKLGEVLAQSDDG